MSKKWTHTESFSCFGATPTNVRWSWAALGRDRAVITLWQDCFSRRGNKLIYKSRGYGTRGPAFNELCKIIEHAQTADRGKFDVIIARARDVNEIPRRATFVPRPDLRMRVDSFNPATGSLSASTIRDAGPCM